MSQELRKKLEREKRARLEAESLLGERSVELTKAIAEIDRLKVEGTKDLGCEQLIGIITSLHQPLKPLLESMADLFTMLPSQSDARAIKDDIRKELANLVSVIQSLHSLQELQDAAADCVPA